MADQVESPDDNRSLEARSPETADTGGTSTGSPRPRGGGVEDTDDGAEPSSETSPLEAVCDELHDVYRRDCRHVGERARALRAAARTHEALGRTDRARTSIERVDRLDDRTEGDRRLERRLLRASSSETDPLVASLETSSAAAKGPREAFFELEAALTTWRRGADPDAVAERLDDLDRNELKGVFSRWWWTQLRTTVALESGEAATASDALAWFVGAQPPAAARRLAVLRLALVEHLCGAPARAADRLTDSGEAGEVGPDIAGLYRHFCFAAGEPERAIEGPGEYDHPGAAGPVRIVETALLELRTDSAPTTVLDRLRGGTDAWPADRTLLALQHDTLAAADDGVETDRADILNHSVEQTDPGADRAIALYRLGRCYETALDNETAAAEVYREAADLESDFVAPIRALRQIAQRREHWSEVAQLLEREIRTTDSRPRRRRLRFRAADVAEFRLDEPERALEHYLAVHDEAYHVPSLRGAARQLASLGRWRELARELLSSVPHAPNEREEARLLREVAHIGEEALEGREIRRRALHELLDMETDLPPEYAELGRLFADDDRWDDLLELNRREVEATDSPRLAAARLVESGRIAERELGDLSRAASFYRSALDRDPDTFGARRGLQRTLRRAERWEEFARTIRDELEHRPDPGRERRLELAERLQGRLDRIDRAADIYRALWEEIRPDDGTAPGPLDHRHVGRALVDIERRRGRWGAVADLLDPAAEGPVREGHAADGRLAAVREAFLDDPSGAHRAYRRALHRAPGHHHWLRGVLRTHAEAGVEPGALADLLEDHLLEDLAPAVRDAYFRGIARLRERAEQTTAASRAHRTHGSDDHRENEELSRLAMAEAGEREQLESVRRSEPVHPLEQLTHLDRREPGDAQRRSLVRCADELLEADETRHFASELPAGATPELVDDSFDPQHRFAAELQRPADGDSPSDSMIEARLRAVRALQNGASDRAIRHLAGELRHRSCRDASLRLLTRAATVAVDDDRARGGALVDAAASLVVDDLDPPDRLPGELDASSLTDADGPVDHATVDRLVLVGSDAGKWSTAVHLLTWEASRDDTGYERRLSLLEEAATIRERELDDPSGALELHERCWSLSEQPDYLSHVVRLALDLDDLEVAVERQRRHFQHLCAGRTEEGDSRPARSGLTLAKLLKRDERPERARQKLEELVEQYVTPETHDDLWRALAYLYLDLDRPRDAVDAFRRFLDLEIDRSELADCRTLVETHAEELADPKTALRLQWQIAQSFPTNRRALERCLELAERAEMLDAAVSHLEALAEDADDRARSALLQFAARGADRYLDRPEQSVGLYDALLESDLPIDEERRDPLQRRRTLNLSRIVGREARAIEEFRRLVRRRPLDREVLESMLDVFERQQANDRVRLVTQVLEALGEEIDAGVGNNRRVKTRPARAFDEPTIEACLIPDELEPEVFRVLQKSVPLAEKIFDDDLPQQKALEGEQLEQHRNAPSRDALDAASSAFEDLGTFTAEVGETGPPEPQVFAGRQPYVWLNSELFRDAGRGDFQFLAGYAAALADAGLAPVLSLDGRRFWHLIEGVWLRRGEGGFDERVDVVSREFEEEVSSPFLAMTRRSVTQAVEPAVDAMADTPCALWPELVEEYACRAGLVLCGDLGAALRCLLRFRDLSMDLTIPQTRRRFSRIDLVGRLLEFAFSRSYLEARYHLGLGGPPGEVGIDPR